MSSEYKFQGAYRTFLALLVLWSHSFLYFFPEFSDFNKLQLGNIAVTSFFVLSGYLMTQAVHYWYSNNMNGFIVNRYLRIVPPLFVATIVSIIVHLIFLNLNNGELVSIETVNYEGINHQNALLAIISCIFPFNIVLQKMINTYSEVHYDFVRYAWAIQVELLFYWCIFSFMLLSRLLSMKLLIQILWVILPIAFIAGLLTYNSQLFGIQNYTIVKVATLIPFVYFMQWIPHFIFGVMLSIYFWKGYEKGLNWYKGVLFIAIVLSVVQLALYASHQPGQYIGIIILGYILCQVILLKIVLHSGDEVNILGVLWKAKNDQRVGTLSYPVYINQYALAIGILTCLQLLNIDAHEYNIFIRIGGFLLFNCIIIIFSAILIYFTDAITDDIRDRIRGVKIT